MKRIVTLCALAAATPALPCPPPPPLPPGTVPPTRAEILRGEAAQAPNIVYGVVERSIGLAGPEAPGAFRLLHVYKGDLRRGALIPMAAEGRPTSCHYGPDRVARGAAGILFLPAWDRRETLYFVDFVPQSDVEKMIHAGIIRSARGWISRAGRDSTKREQSLWLSPRTSCASLARSLQVCVTEWRHSSGAWRDNARRRREGACSEPSKRSLIARQARPAPTMHWWAGKPFAPSLFVVLSPRPRSRRPRRPVTNLDPVSPRACRQAAGPVVLQSAPAGPIRHRPDELAARRSALRPAVGARQRDQAAPPPARRPPASYEPVPDSRTGLPPSSHPLPAAWTGGHRAYRASRRPQADSANCALYPTAHATAADERSSVAALSRAAAASSASEGAPLADSAHRHPR